MSHFTCLVIGEDAETMLAPFDENTEVEEYRNYDGAVMPQDHWAFEQFVERGDVPADADWQTYIKAHNDRYNDEGLQYDAGRGRAYMMSTYNPKSKWDYYRLGGRWGGFFKLKDQLRYPGDVVSHSGAWDSPTPAKGGAWADQARKCDIDFDGMRATAEAEAVSTHAQVRAALAGCGALVRWDRVRKEWFPGDIDAARRFYHDQPGIKALREADLDRFGDDVIDVYFLDHADPAAAYVERARRAAGLTFALLTAEGWLERGRMGWWAVVTDEREDYEAIATRVIDAAPDDALFGVYDLHI